MQHLEGDKRSGRATNSKRLLAASGFLLIGIASTIDAQDGRFEAIPTDIANKVESAMQAARVPGLAIARVEDGAVAWTAVFGERAPGVPMTPDTVFNVASLTKPVFALMTLHLVADGRLALETRLADHWVDPDIAADPRRNALTPRIVLSHQTGFQNWRGGDTLAFAFTPGARHEYSGEGYEYLRRAVERKTGRSMTQLMQSTVLEGAGMTDTSFGWNDALGDRVATGFRASGDPYDTAHLRQRGPNAAANMLTTVGDYARFAAWVADGANLPESLFYQMGQPQALHEEPAESFGLGWRLIDAGEHTVLSHDGRENGVRTQVFVIPATGDGLVILSNSDNGELLTRPLAEMILEQGSKLMAQVDRDTWTFLQRMPSEQVSQIGRVIAGSPSFMSKLLHAVDATLVERAGLSAERRSKAFQAIDPFVFDMLDGRVSPAQAQELVALAIDDQGSEPRWRDAFTPSEAEAWITALTKRQESRATREPVAVAASRLAGYAGAYRVPSSQLLITITRIEGGLQATADGMPVIDLLPESQTAFFMREDDTRFEFVPAENGRTSAVRVVWSNGRSEVAPRVDPSVK